MVPDKTSNKIELENLDNQMELCHKEINRLMLESTRLEDSDNSEILALNAKNIDGRCLNVLQNL